MSSKSPELIAPILAVAVCFNTTVQFQEKPSYNGWNFLHIAEEVFTLLGGLLYSDV